MNDFKTQKFTSGQYTPLKSQDTMSNVHHLSVYMFTISPLFFPLKFREKGNYLFILDWQTYERQDPL